MLGLPIINISRISPSYNKTSLDIYVDHSIIYKDGRPY